MNRNFHRKMFTAMKIRRNFTTSNFLGLQNSIQIPRLNSQRISKKSRKIRDYIRGSGQLTSQVAGLAHLGADCQPGHRDGWLSRMADLADWVAG